MAQISVSSPQQTQDQRTFLIWKLACFALPTAVFVYLLLRYAQNIPATDDFDATLKFVHTFYFTGLSTSQQISSLFAQHNEHRIFVSRLMALLLYTTTGEVNLAWFLYLDSLLLVLLLAVLVVVYKAGKRMHWTVYLVPFLLLMSPHSYETFLVISGGSQSYPALLFSTLSIWILSRSTESASSGRQVGLFSLSVLLAWLATYSFGSGFLVWVGGAVFLFYSRHKSLVIWLAIGLIAVGSYFYNFHRYNAKLEMAGFSGAQILALMKGLILFPGAAFIVQWPSFWAVQLQVIGCYLIGFVSWLYIIYLIFTGYGFRNPLLFSLLSVSLGIAGLLSYSRMGGGSGFLFTSRYLIFTSFVPICLYAIVIDQRLISNRVHNWLAGLLIALFVGSLWTNLPFIEQLYADKQRGFSQWRQTGSPTLYVEAARQAEVSQITKQCIEKGIFQP